MTVEGRRSLRVGATERLSREDGMTLAELIAGMGVMVVALAVFTSVIFAMSNSASSVDSVTTSSNQVDNAFARLDKTIRYASAISTPSTAASTTGMWYVELQTSNTGTTKCQQLQIDPGTSTRVPALNTRSWTLTSGGGAGNLTSFTTLATGVTTPTSGTPFTLNTTGLGNSPLETLTVSLRSAAGTNPNNKSSQLLSTFTAINSNLASLRAADGSVAPSTICQEEGRP